MTSGLAAIKDANIKTTNRFLLGERTLVPATELPSGPAPSSKTVFP